ncbi:MAG: carboxypeptidase regulatory-like domain-containing protein [candidate division Zixibacteria bacterium]|nr:carboxypeptidase regulatory-like domain-containing protein [candidate division Zixibacteria bacterium]
MSFISARLRPIAGLGLLVCIVASSYASAASGPVAGKVTSSLTGLPLANVVVKVLETGDSTQTDGTGHYAFPNLVDGRYTMLFGRNTYQPVTKANVLFGSCCQGTTGNVDCDATNNVDISDLSVLIDNLFINLTPLCCPAAANTDGQLGVDISDLSLLIDYLFINFTTPAPCQ